MSNVDFTGVAKIGDKYFGSVSSALDYAYNNNMKDVAITLLGETAANTSDSVNLYGNYGNGSAFNNITFNQENSSKPYYLNCLYTGWTTGKVVFDGVNIVVTSQLYAIGNFELINNSSIKRTSDVNNFIFYGNMIIEKGSTFESQVDVISSGSVLTVDGGKTDGTLNAKPDYSSVWVTIDNGNSLIIKNGAYARVTNYEDAELKVDGTVNAENCGITDVVGGIAVDKPTSPIEKVQARNGDTYYTTLMEALKGEGNEITLLAPFVVAADKTTVLDLNGKTVSMEHAPEVLATYQMILNYGNLTILDSVGGGKISYTYSGVKLGTSSYAANTITTEPGSVLTVKSGTIENLTYDSAVIAHAIDGRTNTPGAGDVTVNIEGGTITSLRQSMRIYANLTSNTGTLNISGGEMIGRVIVQNANVNANKAALNITGGTFNANAYKTDVLYVGGSNNATIDINAAVTGGEATASDVTAIDRAIKGAVTFTTEGDAITASANYEFMVTTIDVNNPENSKYKLSGELRPGKSVKIKYIDPVNGTESYDKPESSTVLFKLVIE